MFNKPTSEHDVFMHRCLLNLCFVLYFHASLYGWSAGL
jgi:hypothetical protein